jgi:hypothetical protein
MPMRLGYAGPPLRRPYRPFALVGIAITAVVAGMFVGATTNAVNGAVSPIYFEIVMGWDSTGVWLQSVEQGILEGFVIGIFLSSILTLAIGLITRQAARTAMLCAGWPASSLPCLGCGRLEAWWRSCGQPCLPAPIGIRLLGSH